MFEIRDSDWLCDKVASITTQVRVLAYIPRRYNSAAEATSLLSSVASLAKILGVLFRVKIC